MINNALFNLFEANGNFIIEFKKREIIYSQDIKYFDEHFFCTVKDKNLCIKGRATIEIYAYTVFWCIKNGVESINIEDFNLSKLFEIYRRGKVYSDVPTKWCSLSKNKNTAILSIISPNTSDKRWSNEFIQENALPFKIDEPLKSVIITGRGSLLFYSILASSVAISGFENIFIEKPTEKTLLKIAGNLLYEKSENKEAGKMIGVLGDPNCGKSVFSKVFGCILEESSKKNVWVYDCDASAPTSDWYIYGLQQAKSDIEADMIKKARNAIKCKWFYELECKTAESMQNVKKQLEVIVADFPGGYHDEEKNIHKRIPDSGRVEMLKCCDYFVIIGRSDKLEAINEWKSELRKYNLDDKVIAEIISKDPEHSPIIEKYFFDDYGIFHATVCGLDRQNSRKLIVESFYSVFKKFVNISC